MTVMPKAIGCESACRVDFSSSNLFKCYCCCRRGKPVRLYFGRFCDVLHPQREQSTLQIMHGVSLERRCASTGLNVA